MAGNDRFVLGDWNAVCFECGRKFKASQLKRHWQGYYVCPAHWEPRHPQDFTRGVQDIQTPSWTQPMPADRFVAVDNVIQQSGAIAGVAVAGRAIAGLSVTV